jgi:hypothetical protein
VKGKMKFRWKGEPDRAVPQLGDIWFHAGIYQRGCRLEAVLDTDDDWAIKEGCMLSVS